MRQIVIAIDSFKECLQAPEVAAAIARGVKRCCLDTDIVLVPLSDGGEGLVRALVAAVGGREIVSTVHGPLGDPVEAKWGILSDNETAVIEMAQASGIGLVEPKKRNPLKATTYGTGELIKSALDAGCSRIVVGLGGSATVDGGAGMAQALGAKFLDSDGYVLEAEPVSLEKLDRVNLDGIDPRLKETEILVACDVSNPLCGPKGAAAVYGPQKGATPEMVTRLDKVLGHIADLLEEKTGCEVKTLPGAGAAGGMGAGLVGFLGAKLCSGIDLVIDLVGLEAILATEVSLVITGEGEINYQTIYGKVPVGVARVAKKYNVPVVALAGSLGPGAEIVYQHGINGLMSIQPGPMTLEYSMKNAAVLLEDAAERLMRLLIINDQL